MLLKKINVILLCCIIAVLPCVYTVDFSYADDSWHDISELSGDDYKKYIVGGIKAGLKFFGYKETFSYDISKAIWTYNYSQWDKIAKAGGYSGVEELNTKIKYRIDSDYKLHFKVTMSGLQFINDLMHELVNYYGLTQGYTKEIYSGKYFQDDNGIGCYVFIIKDQSSSYSTDRSISDFNTNVLWGTPYRFSGKSYYDSNVDGVNTYTINYDNESYTYHMKVYNGSFNRYDVVGWSTSSVMGNPTGHTGYIYLGPDNPTSYRTVNGWVCITTNNTFSKYYLGAFTEYYAKNNPTTVNCQLYSEIQLEDIPLQNQSINGNYTPNNNTADSDKDLKTDDDNIDDFLENNDPDITSEDISNEPDTPNNPDTGGGTTDGNGNNTYNFFVVPDLDGLNPDPQSIPNKWKIPNLQQKFPFCIPFDLIAIYSVLDTEPQAPRIQQTVDFGSFTYNLDINLNTYDSAMVNIRKFILVLYIFGLLFVTPTILKT